MFYTSIDWPGNWFKVMPILFSEKDTQMNNFQIENRKGELQKTAPGFSLVLRHKYESGFGANFALC